MRLSDMLVREATIYDLRAGDKEGVLREVLASLAAAGRIDGARIDEIEQALIRRERLGTTGIGKGIAVPHAKHDSLEGVIVAIAHSRQGVDFASLDGKPVYTVFLLLASTRATTEHLAALERISAIVRDDDYWRFLRDARSAGEIHDIIAEADAAFGS